MVSIFVDFMSFCPFDHYHSGNCRFFGCRLSFLKNVDFCRSFTNFVDFPFTDEVSSNASNSHRVSPKFQLLFTFAWFCLWFVYVFVLIFIYLTFFLCFSFLLLRSQRVPRVQWLLLKLCPVWYRPDPPIVLLKQKVPKGVYVLFYISYTNKLFDSKSG